VHKSQCQSNSLNLSRQKPPNLDLEDKFNDFENTEAESIQKLYLTQFTIPENNDEPRVILWCHYRSKWPNNSSSRSNH
jgi:hypothetical protein